MPRTPILSRVGFFDYVNRNSKVRRNLEWNLVETELGAMTEPRQHMLYSGLQPIADIDIVDAGFNDQTYMSRDVFYTSMGTDGPQMFFDWNL